MVSMTVKEFKEYLDNFRARTGFYFDILTDEDGNITLNTGLKLKDNHSQMTDDSVIESEQD